MSSNPIEIAAEFIRSFEGMRLSPYDDGVGVWTIGYGHTEGVTKDTASITSQKAEDLLFRDMQLARNAVFEHVAADLNANQEAALISFIFNVGEGNFRRSTLRKKLNAGDYKGAADEFSRWVYAGGKKLSGLRARRRMERKLFETPVIKTTKAPKAARKATVAAGAAAAGAVAADPNLVSQIASAAPAVSVGKSAIETAQENPIGIAIVVVLALSVMAAYFVYRRMERNQEYII